MEILTILIEGEGMQVARSGGLDLGRAVRVCEAALQRLRTEWMAEEVARQVTAIQEREPESEAPVVDG